MFYLVKSEQKTYQNLIWLIRLKFFVTSDKYKFYEFFDKITYLKFHYIYTQQGNRK